MKRSLFILLSLILSSILVLSACGSSGDEDIDEADEIEQEDTTEIDENNDEKATDDTGETEQREEADEESEEQEAAAAEEEETNEEGENSEEETEIVEENDVFRIFEPESETVVDTEFTVRGEARVNGGTVYYEFEDGHNILDEGTASASAEAPDWGEFELTIQFDEVAFTTGTIVLYEESKDGSRQNQLYIPVTVE